MRQTFVASPLFGSLHLVRSDRFVSGHVPAWTRLLGCTQTTRRDGGWAIDDVLPPQETLTRYDTDPRHRDWSNTIRRSLNRWPLSVIIDRIEKRSLRQRSTFDEAGLPAVAMLDELLGAWTYSRNPECLPRALFRYAWLRRRAVQAHFVLGAHIPTDRMHSWVEVDGCAVGEEPDDMLCYQGLVRFFPRHRQLEASA